LNLFFDYFSSLVSGISGNACTVGTWQGCAGIWGYLRAAWGCLIATFTALKSFFLAACLQHAPACLTSAAKPLFKATVVTMAVCLAPAIHVKQVLPAMHWMLLGHLSGCKKPSHP